MIYRKILASILALAFSLPLSGQESATTPLRVGVVGLAHSHVHWILGRPDRGDIEIVGIAEPNRNLARRFAAQHGFSMDIVFDTIEEEKGSFEQQAPPRQKPLDDPFAFLHAVVRKRIEVQPSDLSALENNLIVMEILDAAIRSAKSGKTIRLTN